MPGKIMRHVAQAVAWTAPALVAGTSFAVVPPAEFTPPVPYLSVADSPFLDPGGWDGNRCHSIEDFQSGGVSVPGLSFLSLSGTRVVSPGGVADPGATQYALSGTTSVGVIQLDFPEDLYGDRPQRVGFAWTRGFNGTITLTAVNGRGRVANHVHVVNTPNLPGNPADDLFFGVESERGIASLMISFNPPIFCEIDHVQFSQLESDSDLDGTPDCLDECDEDSTNHCRRRGDLNGDGVPDVIVQNNSSRTVSAWLLGPDGSIGSVEGVLTPAAGQVPVATADFGADGIRELVLQNAAARQLFAWSLGGPHGTVPIRGEAVLGPDARPFAPPTNLAVQGSIDADADGQVDLLARDLSTGLLHVWKMSGTRVVSTRTLPAVPSSPVWNIAGVIEGPDAASWIVVGHNRVNRRVTLWTVRGSTLASTVAVTGAGGAPVQTPVGSTVVGVRRFADDDPLSLLVRAGNGRVDRWRLDAQGRYLRGSAVTPSAQQSVVPRPD